MERKIDLLERGAAGTGRAIFTRMRFLGGFSGGFVALVLTIVLPGWAVTMEESPTPCAGYLTHLRAARHELERGNRSAAVAELRQAEQALESCADQQQNTALASHERPSLSVEASCLSGCDVIAFSGSGDHRRRGP